jgi:predicted ATP-grasp superfamily ATP-dependent carboligase
MRALILGSGNVRGGLAAARYLTRAGWWVAAATLDAHGPVAWSRATRVVYPIPRVESGLDAFVEATIEAVRDSRCEVVLPVGDAELLAISHARAAIPAVVPYADDAVVRRSVDKLELVRAAHGVGLLAPETVPAHGAAIENAWYPILVKSRFHWLPDHPTGAPSRLNPVLVEDPSGARAAVDEMMRAGTQPVLQEIVDGTPVNVHIVVDRSGKTLTMTQQDGPQLFYPPRVGTRVRAVVNEIDQVFETGIPALLRELGWFGFVSLAFLRSATGAPYLIDLNGRIPANLEASAGAGPNCMAVWAALATGRSHARIPPPMVGKRFQNLEGDLRRALHERRGGVIRDVGGSLAYALRAQHTIAKWDQPSIVVRYSLRLLRESRYARALGRSRRADA